MKRKRLFTDIVRRVFVAILCVSFVFQQSLVLPLLAESVITPDTSAGMAPDITQNGNIWDINPNFSHGSTDFGHFNQFNLTEGDIANLINSIDRDKFVALVNNQVNINGILNILNSSGAFNNVAIFEEKVTPIIQITTPNEKADITEVNTAERNFFLSSDVKRRDNTDTAPIVKA